MPGTRFLRRERVPLYVVLSESQLRNDGAQVVILRGGIAGPAYDLSDTATLNLTVQAGDVITVTSRPQEFYYIGWRANYPGQKMFQVRRLVGALVPKQCQGTALQSGVQSAFCGSNSLTFPVLFVSYSGRFGNP